LITAVLFLSAGLAWQFLAPPSPSVHGEAAKAISPPAVETVKPGAPDKAVDSPLPTGHSKPVLSEEKGTPAKPVVKETEPGNRTAKATMAPVAADQETGRVPHRKENLSTAPRTITQSDSVSNSTGTEIKVVAGPKEIITPPEPGRYPYSILLASFKMVTLAEAAISKYQARGLDSFWVQVDLGDKGVWYRVYSGNYTTKAEAQAVVTQFSLDSALIKEFGLPPG